MEEVEKAYIAGIIDGEGTVSLTKHHPNETPAPYVAIANNNLALLHWVKRKVGSGHISTKGRRKEHYGISYTWHIRFNKAIDFLNEIREYLIIKKPHANLIVKEYKPVTKRNGRYSQAMLKRKMQLVARIRKLNQR